jgi:hypothetical protein
MLLVHDSLALPLSLALRSLPLAHLLSDNADAERL